MIQDTFAYEEKYLSKNLCVSTENLLHVLTAAVKFLLLSNKLILIMVMYCKFFLFFCEMTNINSLL